MGMSSSCMRQLAVSVGLFFKIYFYEYEKDQINDFKPYTLCFEFSELVRINLHRLGGVWTQITGSTDP